MLENYNSEEAIYEESLAEFDLDELDEQLQEQLNLELEGLEYLKKESDEIGNPENLGEKIKDVIWEQFLLQIGTVAGEDFIKENRGLTLDLRDEAHIQTTENFKNKKFATHNTSVDYEQRYNDWQENFNHDTNTINNSNYRDNNGTVEKFDNRSGEYKKVLTKDARKDYDKKRPKGSKSKNTNVDHTISAAEIIRDEEAATYMTHEEKVEFANSDVNLNEMDSAANQSKGDSTTTEWLESERDGKKASERFNVDEKELKKKDKKARKEYEEKKKKAKEKAIEEGKKSQKEEAKKIGTAALRSAVMQLFAELIKTIIRNLIKWFKTAKRNIDSLLGSMKVAIKEFFSKLKTHLKNTANGILDTIGTAIFQRIFTVIKKIWMSLCKIGSVVKEAINYLKDPKNKNKSFGVRMLELGKIVTVSLAAIGAISLGEIITGMLSSLPIFLIEIPLLGSLASIIGIFLGAVVAGVLGALVINFIEKKLEKKLKDENTKKKLDKGNDIMVLQEQLYVVNQLKLDIAKIEVAQNIYNRHQEAGKRAKEVVDKINSKSEELEEMDNILNEINNLLIDF